MQEKIIYRHMELWLCDTCTFRCGYCASAESGAVLNKTHLDFYKKRENINKITTFFNTYSSLNKKWVVSFTGGEPLLVPNLDIIITELINQGNKVCFYTNLSIPLDHDNYCWINEDTAKYIEYFMCSFHPEWIGEKDIFFKRVKKIKEMGAKPIVRFVGHPQLLYLLKELQERCMEINVTFYPTSLFSRSYPRNYSKEEKNLLQKYMKGFSPLIQLEGGLNVTGMRCYAGSRLFAANIPMGGDIRPCISTSTPVIGNILKCELNKFHSSVECFREEKLCTCDIHFQQGFVENADDTDEFILIKLGKGRSCLNVWQYWKSKNSLKTTNKYFVGQGGVKDDSILVYKERKK